MQNTLYLAVQVIISKEILSLNFSKYSYLKHVFLQAYLVNQGNNIIVEGVSIAHLKHVTFQMYVLTRTYIHAHTHAHILF